MKDVDFRQLLIVQPRLSLSVAAPTFVRMVQEAGRLQLEPRIDQSRQAALRASVRTLSSDELTALALEEFRIATEFDRETFDRQQASASDPYPITYAELRQLLNDVHEAVSAEKRRRQAAA